MPTVNPDAGIKYVLANVGDPVDRKPLTEKEREFLHSKLKLQEGIGQNQQYQDFVVRQKQVEAQRDVGLEQARAMGEALGKAGIKVISTIGGGSANLGNQLGAMFEGLGLTSMGSSLLSKIGIKGDMNEGSKEAPTGGVKRVSAEGANASTKKT